MKVALINGSPKANGSASGVLLGDLQAEISGKVEVVELGLHRSAVPEDALAALQSAGVWVFACPLYVDGIPGHLLSCLMQLEKADWMEREKRIYAIVNCGFYEGVQAEYALSVLSNWCGKAGLIWAGGVGIGGGGSLCQMPAAKNGHGPKAPIDRALKMLAEKILQCEAQEEQYVSVAFPRFLYKMAAQMGWRQMIKVNGGKAKDLGRQPE